MSPCLPRDEDREPFSEDDGAFKQFDSQSASEGRDQSEIAGEGSAVFTVRNVEISRALRIDLDLFEDRVESPPRRRFADS